MIRLRPVLMSLLALAAFAILAPAAFAQTSTEPIVGYIYGGWSVTTGETSTYLDDGWALGGGVIYHPNPGKPFAARLDVGYNQWDATNELLSLGRKNNVRIDDGWGRTWAITADALYEMRPGQGTVGAYLGAGIGGYWRYVGLTQEALYGGYICDPWWGYCYPATTVGDVVTADDHQFQFGWNASAGITFETSGGGEIFIEARYHWINTNNKATEFIPISLGYRF